MRMKHFAAVVLSCAIMACAQVAKIEPVEGADITVVAEELGTGTWRIDYLLDAPQSALIFSRSKGDYRTGSWTPVGDAPEVERVGGFDALIFDTPTDRFSYEITPYTDKLPQDYTPFLGFSDGGLALFTGQFEVLAVEDKAAIEALEGNLMNWQGQQGALGVRVRSERPMLVQGLQVNGVTDHVSTGGGTYVYVGDSELQEGSSYIGVIDSALPDHLRDSLDQDLEALFRIYDDRWGFSLPSKATLYFAFEGFDNPGHSLGGSVLGTNLMVLQASGEALREQTLDNRIRALWFFAHEGAHMYQSQVMTQFNVGPDAWIHEGGANTLANSTIRALPDIPHSFIESEYRTAFESCVSDLENGSLMTAHVDGRFYAHYHCGQIFNAAVDAALPDHDLYEFWKAFSAEIDPEDGGASEAFFATFEALGGDPEISLAIKRLAYEDEADPRAGLIDLMMLSGMAPSFDKDGTLLSLNVPQ